MSLFSKGRPCNFNTLPKSSTPISLQNQIVILARPLPTKMQLPLRTGQHYHCVKPYVQRLATDLQQRQHPHFGHPGSSPPPCRDHPHRWQKLPDEGPSRFLKQSPLSRRRSQNASAWTGGSRGNSPHVQTAFFLHLHAAGNTSFSARWRRAIVPALRTGKRRNA